MLHLIACNPSTNPSAQVQNSPIAGSIKISAPDGNTVGNEIKLLIATENSAIQSATLLVDNGLTIRTITTTTNQSISIPSEWLQKSGLYKLTAIQNNKIIATRKLRLNADAITGPLEVYTGPVTILVNGQEESMVTYIPADRYDNAIIKASSINYTSTNNDDEEIGTLINLVSYKKHRADTKANKVILGVKSELFASPEQAIEEIADWPANINISVVTHHPYADNRQYTRLRTNPLLDKYGNQIADGTLVTFYQHKDNFLYSSYKSLVVDGVANAYLRNPNEAGQFQYQAVTGAVSSNTLRLDYARLINDLPVTYDSISKTLKVGPLVSALGQLVPEGTEVILNKGNSEFIEETIEGSVTFKLSQQQVLSKTVTIISGGFSKTIEL